MPKQIIAIVATVFVFAVYFGQPAAAQYHHGYGSHYGGVHGHAQGYHHGIQHHADNHHGYGGHARHHDDFHHGHAPSAFRYAGPAVVDAYSAPLAGPRLDYGYNDLDAYCPDTVGCPLQYQAPATIAPLYQQGAPYANVPSQRAIPNDFVNPNDHAGHDHGDHSHDGHDHGSPSSQPGYLGGTVDTPDRQPMTSPTLPNHNRSSAPLLREWYPSVPETSGGSIRMDGPPPPSLTRFDRTLDPQPFQRL